MFFRVGPIRRILWYLKRKWGPINESDVDINSDFELRPDGSRSINIPVRYIKRIPNPRYINSDVFGSVMRFYEMAKNYNTKTEKIPLFNIVLDKLKNNNTENRNQRTLL
jgi:hypothetical protein